MSAVAQFRKTRSGISCGASSSRSTLWDIGQLRDTAAMNRTLIIIGITLVVVGLLWKPLSSLPFFRLPGDIVIDRPGFKAYFPFMTMIVVSAVVSLLLWLFRR
jgi:hypothetical protein